EEAVLIAIDSFDPDTDANDNLFQNAVSAAVRLPVCTSNSSGSFLPVELQSVLNLPGELPLLCAACPPSHVEAGVCRLIALECPDSRAPHANCVAAVGRRGQFEFRPRMIPKIGEEGTCNISY